MDRRESLKSIVLGSLAGSFAMSCKNELEVEEQEAISTGATVYGRTDKEKAIDEELYAQQFFNTHEMDSLRVLCALILPANDSFGSATDAGSPDFIEFMAKDYPGFQHRLRGGLMWLDHESNTRFNKEFKTLEAAQQTQILDEIAYYDYETPYSERPFEVNFFSLLRNLTLTGYFTSEMGIKDLGYKGNTPNVWDGVPQDVLAKHGVSYEKEWLEKCIDQSTRADLARWDDQGNLLN